MIMPALKISVYSVISIGLIGYIALCGFLFVNQEEAIFPLRKMDPNQPYPFTSPFEEVFLPVDGATLNAVHFKAENPKGVILFFHGNGDIILFLEPFALELVSYGYDVFIPDYREYGKSTGEITSEAELHEDMAEVYQYLLNIYPEEQIILYGKSIGTGFAVKLAAENAPKLLILESPYFSLVDLVQSRISYIPGLLLKYQFRSDLYIGEVEAPTYIIHGGNDPVIPHEQSERLFELITSEKDYLFLPEAGHGYLVRDFRVSEFLDKILKD